MSPKKKKLLLICVSADQNSHFTVTQAQFPYYLHSRKLLLPLFHFIKFNFQLKFNLIFHKTKSEKLTQKNEDYSTDSNGLWRSWFSPSPTHCLMPFSSLFTGKIDSHVSHSVFISLYIFILTTTNLVSNSLL